jgi:tetratricopeptide (TPR) repeat protein
LETTLTIRWQPIAGLIAAQVFAFALPAAPFLPDDNSQVLEQLPQASDAVSRELHAMRNTLAANPQQTDLIIKLAKRYIELGKSESDPRYYGYAQGLLQPWWTEVEPPPNVLLLRALILQNRHDFNSALRDLEKLLRRQPDNAEAWLTQAIILQVQARYEEAQQSCAALINFDETLPAATCLSQTGSLMGQGLKSYQFLADSLKEAVNISPEQHQWTLTVLAEIAARLGKNDAADRHFIEAIRIRRPDAYLLAAYADFLLDRNRPGEVVDLLSDKTRIDSLLLRLALAKQQLAANDLPEIVNQLQARFAASRLRNENLHQGDEARFTLYLLRQPQAAMQLAKANWQLQKEPKDARILLEAAIAANEPEAAKPVIDLLVKTGMEHVKLRELVERLKAKG